MADVSVTLAHFWTDPQTGKSYSPEQKASVDPARARQLIRAGIAQPDEKAEAKAAKESPKAGAAKADGGA
jgi:hypothetical protein